MNWLDLFKLPYFALVGLLIGLWALWWVNPDTGPGKMTLVLIVAIAVFVLLSTIKFIFFRSSAPTASTKSTED